MIENLATSSWLMIAAIVVGDFLLLCFAFFLAGPAFMLGRDLIGRRREVLGRLGQVVVVISTLALCAYLGAQVFIAGRYLPYWTSEGTPLCEQITRLGSSSVAPDGRPRDGDPQPGDITAFWVTTERHRFGVTPAIAAALREVTAISDEGVAADGPLVAGRYRPSDDLLYAIGIAGRAPADAAVRWAACEQLIAAPLERR